ncbi:MAG: bifunctional ADP-dependent NAD(P)H-hydrate dehydratase/NAD(P)H-hydrate epimerase, partial [Caldiserica bacterium CG23_combo_of_CG06-09_8_20_14_all_35_60]
MKVASVNEMRNLDKLASEEFGIKDELLMENAGIAVYDVIRENLGVKGKKFLIFAGTGNNGGDGFVAARKIASSGGEVSVFILGEESEITGIAKINLDRLHKFPVEIYTLKSVN